MNFTETKLKGAYIIDLIKIEDERGFFGRAYCKKEFEKIGLKTEFVQANLSFNKQKATLRGLHLQNAPHAETKLVRCIRGSIYDVIVDIRKGSSTFLQWIGVNLTADNHRMLYVPEGFAHSYITLEDNSEVLYQVSEYYTANAERGFRWDDPAFSINWPVTPQIISERDQNHQLINSETSFY